MPPANKAGSFDLLDKNKREWIGHPSLVVFSHRVTSLVLRAIHLQLRFFARMHQINSLPQPLINGCGKRKDKSKDKKQCHVPFANYKQLLSFWKLSSENRTSALSFLLLIKTINCSFPSSWKTAGIVIYHIA